MSHASLVDLVRKRALKHRLEGQAKKEYFSTNCVQKRAESLKRALNQVAIYESLKLTEIQSFVDIGSLVENLFFEPYTVDDTPL